MKNLTYTFIYVCLYASVRSDKSTPVKIYVDYAYYLYKSLPYN